MPRVFDQDDLEKVQNSTPEPPEETPEEEEIQEEPEQPEEPEEPEVEEEDPTEVFESVEFPNIKKIGDEFVLIVDPEDENSTVYKGETAAELFENIHKGLQAKDSYIKELKEKGELEPEKPKKKQKVSLDPGTEKLEYPNAQTLINQSLQRYGVDPQVLNWGKEEWKQFEEENSASEAMVMRQKVDKAQQEAQSAYDQQTAQVLNNTQLEEESEAVTSLLERFDIDPKDFDYKAVLDRVQSNKDNFYENGIRRSGAIVTEAMSVVHELLKGNISSKVSNEVSLNFRKTLNKAKKASKATPKGKPKPKEKETPSPPKTTREAIAQIRKEFADQLK